MRPVFSEAVERRSAGHTFAWGDVASRASSAGMRDVRAAGAIFRRSIPEGHYLSFEIGSIGGLPHLRCWSELSREANETSPGGNATASDA